MEKYKTLRILRSSRLCIANEAARREDIDDLVSAAKAAEKDSSDAHGHVKATELLEQKKLAAIALYREEATAAKFVAQFKTNNFFPNHDKNSTDYEVIVNANIHAQKAGVQNI
jgi:hypothetical protein